MSCESMATSMEELGNDIYPKAKRKLEEMNINVERHIARQVKKNDYDKYDLFIVFEERNKRDLLNILGEDFDNKVHLILEYSDSLRDIADPWYTDDFDIAFDEINEGCHGLFNYLIEMGRKDEV